MLFSPVFAAQQSATEAIHLATDSPSAPSLRHLRARRLHRPGRGIPALCFCGSLFDSNHFLSTTPALFLTTAPPQPLPCPSLPHPFHLNGGCISSLFFYRHSPLVDPDLVGVTRLPRRDRGH